MGITCRKKEKEEEEIDMHYSKKDVKEKQDKLRAQNTELYQHRKIKITCAGGCKRKINIIYAYRCFFCRLWFCKTCSKPHFTKEKLLKKQSREINPHRKNIKVTCAGCQKKVSIAHTYRCFFCLLRFCWTCSGFHFVKESEIRYRR